VAKPKIGRNYGMKYNDNHKASAIALIEAGKTQAEVAKSLKIPRTTLCNWYAEYRHSQPVTEQTEIEKKQEFIAKVETFKNEFSASAQSVVGLATELVERRLKRAANQEAAIDKAIEMISQDEELSYAQKKEIINQLKQIKVEDISKLSIVAGTFYDKQALANKEATSIIDGNITVKKFEDF